MFHTMKQFQGRSVKGGPANSTKSFRDTMRVVDRDGGGLTMGGSGTSGSNNDAEQLSCWEATKEHLKRELWSYVGLLGLFSIYFGILVCVYALKGLFVQRGVMTFCGLFLTGVGGMHLLISWMCYRCRKKHRRFSCFSDDQDTTPPSPKPSRTRPRGQSLAGFLTPEFAKYAEFSARDRRYDTKRHNFFKGYDPTQISISFAHKYWLEQQKPLLETGFGNPTLFPSFPASPRNFRSPQSMETKRRLLETDKVPKKRRQLST